MRPGRAGAAVVALAVGFGMLGIAPASAHDYLVSSTPGEGTTVTEVPSAFSATMNAPLLDLAGDGSGFALQVTDAAGLFYGTGCLSIEGSTLSMPATLGEAGDYTFVWQIISEDGHPTSESFSFTYAPAAGVEPTVGESAPPVCGVTGVEPVETATPEPTEEPSPEASATAEPVVPVTGDAPTSDALWIGGAALAVLIAGGVTFLVARRRKSTS